MSSIAAQKHGATLLMAVGRVSVSTVYPAAEDLAFVARGALERDSMSPLPNIRWLGGSWLAAQTGLGVVNQVRVEWRMELHEARYFLALAKSLNFTRAAEQCRVTQPALTKAVQKLEQELDGALIYRERHLTQLTDLGKLVLPMVERTLAAADSVRFHAREFRRKGIAPLKIALDPSVSAIVVAQPLSELARVIPRLQVDLVEAQAHTVPTLLLDGEVNAAICGDVDVLPDRIDHWRLFDERFNILAAAGSPLCDYDAVPMHVLADAVWLERIGCRIWRRFWADHFPEAHEPRIAHRGQQLSHLHHMVTAGLGIMLAAEHEAYPPSLVARPIAGEPLRREVQLLVVAGRQYSPALDAFIKTLRLQDWKTALRKEQCLGGGPHSREVVSRKPVAARPGPREWYNRAEQAASKGVLNGTIGSERLAVGHR